MSKITLLRSIVYQYPISVGFPKFVLTYKRNSSHLYWKVKWNTKKHRAVEHVNLDSNLNPATD